MRELAMMEIFREKCQFCGCKNKLMTDITSKGQIVGYTIRCCNCGHVDTFVNLEEDNVNITLPLLLSHNTQFGKSKYIQPSGCTHTKCVFYRPCPESHIKETVNGVDLGGRRNIKKKNKSVLCNQLTINAQNNKKFL